jgi:hypothetical protein
MMVANPDISDWKGHHMDGVRALRRTPHTLCGRYARTPRPRHAGITLRAVCNVVRDGALGCFNVHAIMERAHTIECARILEAHIAL